MTARRHRLAIAAVLGATTVLSLVPVFVDGWWLDVSKPGSGPSSMGPIAFVLQCWISVVAGLIARERRPGNPIGTWLILSGMLSTPAFIVGGGSAWIAPVSAAAFSAAASFGAAIPIAFPTGRLDGRAPAAIASVAIVCFLFRVEQLALFDPSKSIPGWTTPNPYYTTIDRTVLDVVGVLYSVLGMAYLLVFGFWLARRWWRLTGPARLGIAPVLTGALLFVATSVEQSLLEAAGVTGPALEVSRVVHTLSFAAVPVGLLAGLLRVQIARSAVADLVVELGETPEPSDLRRALVAALRDPTLEVVLWSREEGGFVGADGAVIADLDAAARPRAVTLLERDGAPLAAILHDPALLDDPGLVASVGTAVRLTVENDRLQEEVRAQLGEVRASRARIVEATDAERRRLERDIHDGAQQRLVALSLAIGRARGQLGSDADPALASTLAQASDEVRAALTELRELARGIHPAILTEAGLEAAVRSLVERAAIPSTLTGSVPRRLPPPVEATAYFVVSEALTNAGKHADAAAAAVTLALGAKSLTVEVRDDGRGGADPAAGSGIRGLRDRAEAIGGVLEIESPEGRGTLIRAVLPVPGAVV